MDGIKRVAAVHDLSGYGRCSLSVILPVLAAMGASVSPAMTAYLSAHTGFPASEHAVRLDMTDALAGTVDHWLDLGVCFDAVYSGYLASQRQVAPVARLIDAQRDALVLIDPVLGDHGRAYRGITPEHCAAMAELAELADVITPNLTECSLLLREPYCPAPDEAVLRRYLTALGGGGRRAVVITGVRPTPGRIGAAVMGRADDTMRMVSCPEADGSFSGTGDLFAAVLLGGLLRGGGVYDCAARAASFAADCAAYTAGCGASGREGIIFEALLGALIG